MAKKKQNKAQLTRIETLTRRINTWARPARIAANTLITVVFTFIVGYIISVILFGTGAEPVDPDLVTPFLVGVSVLALLIYGLGWWLLVGFDWNPDQPWRARPATTYFILAGLAATGLVILSILGLLVFGFLL